VSNTVAFILSGLIIVIVIVVFIRIFKKRNELLEIEVTSNLLKSYTSGGSFNNDGIITKMSYPFVQIRLYDEFFVVSYTNKLLFKYGEIKSLRSTFNGIMIEHDKRDYPKKINIQMNSELISFFEEKNIEIIK